MFVMMMESQSTSLIKVTLLYLCIQVICSNPDETEEPVAIRVLRHGTETLPCSVDFSITQSDKVAVTWYMKTRGSVRERRITSGILSLRPNKFKVDKPAPNEWNLNIKRIDESDEALYRCEWKIPFRSETAALYRLEVESPPAIDESLTSPKYVTFREGEKANLTCVMTGKPKPKITWYRYHRSDFSQPENLGVTGNFLIIPDIKRHAGDVYLCIGENRHEKKGWEIDVKVRFKPHLEVHKRNITVKQGTRVQMSCLVQASSSVDWHWFNNKGDIINPKKPNYKYLIEPPERIDGYPAEVSTLFLRQSFWDYRDFGTYRCQAIAGDHKVEGQILIRDPRDVG